MYVERLAGELVEEACAWPANTQRYPIFNRQLANVGAEEVICYEAIGRLVQLLGSFHRRRQLLRTFLIRTLNSGGGTALTFASALELDPIRAIVYLSNPHRIYAKPSPRALLELFEGNFIDSY